MDDRLNVWKKRFETPNDKQYILVAEWDGNLIGFVCTYLDYHPQWGAFLDNLHVNSKWQGHGIGARLLKASGQWVHTQNPVSKMYLKVLDDNHAAIGFYEKVGGHKQEWFLDKMPHGDKVGVFRFVWKNLSSFVTT